MKEYSTTDIVLAAALKVHGYELNRIERSGSKGVFVFDNVEDLFINEYDLGKILVEPTQFNNAIKQLTTSVRRMLK